MSVLEPITLESMRVLVTRAEHQAGGFAKRLTDRGALVTELPMLEIAVPADCAPVDAAINSLHRFDWIFFTSANAVNSFLGRARDSGRAELPEGISIGSIGPATSEAVKSFGHHIRYQAPEFIQESFVQGFTKAVGAANVSSLRILWPHAANSRNYIAESLSRLGANMVSVICYRSALPTNAKDIGENLHRLIVNREIDAITLASAQTARNLSSMLHLVVSPDVCRALLRRCCAVTIGPETTKAAHAVGFGAIEQANTFTTDGMLAVLENLAARKINAP